MGGHLFVYCTSPGWWMMMSVEQSVEWLAGEIEVLGENVPDFHFVHHKSRISRTRAASMGSRRLTAWATERPCILFTNLHIDGALSLGYVKPHCWIISGTAEEENGDIRIWSPIPAFAWKRLGTVKTENIGMGCQVYFHLQCVSIDRLRGLVVRVTGYRSRGPGFIPSTTRFS
jgi:hypothetical protein